ncbi:drug/metabolite transporter (DMT)-like permease [Rhodoligotrophos appendicifer]|uniref:DMT family transporter n=1 Tax=Rhodoligotrophos appendicifer TaxID=987056 RepID=UPI00117FE60F|nr:DMT family transporter [Rhodoligotrophos appendicifer]
MTSGKVPGEGALSRLLGSSGAAIALVCVAAVTFTGSDILTKQLTGSLPVLEVAWLRYASFSALLIVLALAQRRGSVVRPRALPLQIGRGVMMSASTFLYAAGLAHLPIAVAAATNFVSPVFITLLAGLILRETISLPRWGVVLLGLAGVLVVIRPGTAAFDPAIVFPLAAALSFAFGAIATWSIAKQDGPVITLLCTALVGLVILSAPLPFLWVPLSWDQALLGFGVGLSSTIGHYLVIQAARLADASLLAPFFYLQIVSNGILGYVFFSSVPDLWTVVGSGLIIASGAMAFLLKR